MNAEYKLKQFSKAVTAMLVAIGKGEDDPPQDFVDFMKTAPGMLLDLAIFKMELKQMNEFGSFYVHTLESEIIRLHKELEEAKHPESSITFNIN